MIVLVINSGSSSLKYQLIDMTTEKVLAKGICDKIGFEESFFHHQALEQEEIHIKESIPNHATAVQIALVSLSHKENGAISSLSEISAIGHRVLHGGEYFHAPSLVDEKVLDAIDKCCELGPLHNPSNLKGIKVCKELLPNTPNVAVFDTAFHQTMPKYAYMYGLPYDLYEKYKIRRYGFHGSSHRYVSQKAAELMGKPIEDLKIITCHLGNGSSICAVNGGKSVDTSMGFTPLEGLIMGTRCGSIDPAIVTFLMEKEGMNTDQMTNFLNKKSGVLGLSGLSSDFRDIGAAVAENNERASLAIDVFCYTIKKYIGQYFAILNGADAIVFTGGIGERDWKVRNLVLENLDYLGVKFNDDLNKNGSEQLIFNGKIDISAKDSKVKTFVISTNEELVIAQDTIKVVSSMQ